MASAIDLAKLASAPLCVVGIVPAPLVYSDEGGIILEVLAENRRAFEALVNRSAESARTAGVRPVTTEVREGAIIDQLLGFLDEKKPDLLVMGARGLSTTARLLLGSVSDGVLHHANCSILIVRPPTAPPRVAKGRARRT
ncbi:MAG: universal stress protein [Thermoplasmata archaeon]|nr:universal stress protein [Thermoplasmata archaeon]